MNSLNFQKALKFVKDNAQLEVSRIYKQKLIEANDVEVILISHEKAKQIFTWILIFYSLVALRTFAHNTRKHKQHQIFAWNIISAVETPIILHAIGSSRNRSCLLCFKVFPRLKLTPQTQEDKSRETL